VGVISSTLHIHSWFTFPEWMSENRLRTQLVGQSVDGAVARAIGTEVFFSLMKSDMNTSALFSQSDDLLL
jgi:hypothetical protein